MHYKLNIRLRKKVISWTMKTIVSAKSLFHLLFQSPGRQGSEIRQWQNLCPIQEKIYVAFDYYVQ